MTDTLIFDLDGTLLNTLEDLADSTNYALRACNLPERSLEEVRQFVGNGVEMLIRRATAGALTEERELECLSIFKAYYREHMYDKTRPYDGIMELVRGLSGQGYRIAIVSNKFDLAVKELNRIYFENLFPLAVGESDKVAKKPAPDAVFEVLKQFRSDPDHALYVGDSDVDILTAEHAGVPFAGVTWGFREEAFLLEHGAKRLIHRPEQLWEILQGNNKGSEI